MVEAVIEIPTGDNRRRHINYAKTAFIDLGLIRDKIPVNDGVMPASYGFIPHTHNESDNDEIDIIVVSDCVFEVGEQVAVRPVAIINREDGDHKIIATEDDEITSWEAVPEKVKQLISEILSHKHSFTIGSAKDAEDYIKSRQSTVEYKIDFKKHRH